ncbi:hypothetical protein OIO90_003386 [Microbotryomycetes sp. JL221]|nr:hypothetical protein OIO90_003386 [Microbotryomycetes sp. JL221]
MATSSMMKPTREDPFNSISSTSPRKPLVFHTPCSSMQGLNLGTTGVAMSDKARAASIFGSTSAGMISVSDHRLASGSLSSSTAPTPSSTPTWRQQTPAASPQMQHSTLPTSPATPALSRSGDSSDIEMCCATPPTIRVSGAHAKPARRPSLLSREEFSISNEGTIRPMKPLPRPSVAIKTASQPLTATPPTPPLTPLSPSIGLSPLTEVVPSCSLPPTPPAVAPSTVSGRALYNYHLHPLFQSQYIIQEELGSGGFGFVVRADRAFDGLSVAVKFIERAKIPSHGWVKSRHWGEAPGLSPLSEGYRVVPLEAFVLRSIKHKGVVGFIDLFEDAQYFYLVMEHHGTPWQSTSSKADAPVTSPSNLPALANSPASPVKLSPVPLSTQSRSPLPSPTLEAMDSSGMPCMTATAPVTLAPPRPAPMERRASCDLFECIEQHSRFSENVAKYVFAQIVEVVRDLGRMGCCHRDIKDENIVIGNDLRVKLIDFGSAMIFNPREAVPFANRFYGTTSFASAEILRGEPYQAPSSEVWSLGVLLSILVTGECPFADAESAKQGRLSKPKVRLGSQVQALMRGCLQVDIDQRLTIDEVRSHPWLGDIVV